MCGVDTRLGRCRGPDVPAPHPRPDVGLPVVRSSRVVGGGPVVEKTTGRRVDTTTLVWSTSSQNKSPTI